MKLSCYGQIDAIEMNSSKKFFPLPKKMTVTILQTLLNQIQQIISNFICSSKKSRIKAWKLHQCLHYGGLPVPNINLYYQVTMLIATLQWWQIDTVLYWGSKQSGLTLILLDRALLDDRFRPKVDTHLNRIYKAMMHVWTKY